MPVDPLNYEMLRKKQQLERNSPRLTRLDSSFYRDLELYLLGLQEDLQREQGANPGSAKATLLHDELTNTRRLAEDLYEHREGKVMKAALTAARGAPPDATNMLQEERELYEALNQLLRETKRRTLHRPAGPRAPPPMAVPQIPPAPVSTNPPAAQTASSSGLMPSPPPPAAPMPPPATMDLDEGRVLVRVLEDIGAFAASDLRTYHVRREDVLSLPADTAKILILRGKAIEITATG